MITLKNIVFLLFLTSINGYKILIYNPKMGHSHVNFMSQMTKLLVNAGHDVFVVSSNADEKLKDPFYTPGKIYNVEPAKLLVEIARNETFLKNVWKSSKDIFGQMATFNMFKEAARAQGLVTVNDKELEKLVLSQKFDVAIAEGMNYYMFGLFKAWNIKTTIAATSSVMFDNWYPMFGIPFPTSYVPSIMHGSNDKMTYFERFSNIITHFFLCQFPIFDSEYVSLQDIFDERYGKGFYSAKTILTDS
uniref:glucuronosyltransferase n=1 Tax=Parastrongyloides trichosuri TaxID=131310 RepID=A0A0N4Z8Z0_PARTI